MYAFALGLLILRCLPFAFAQAAAPQTPEQVVTQAWTLARTSSSYAFQSAVDQQSQPAPSLQTAGRPVRHDYLTLRGRLVNPPTPSFTDVAPASTFYPYIETAVCHAVLGGYNDGTFCPTANATRGQISKIVYFALSSGAGCGPAATPAIPR